MPQIFTWIDLNNEKAKILNYKNCNLDTEKLISLEWQALKLLEKKYEQEVVFSNSPCTNHNSPTVVSHANPLSMQLHWAMLQWHLSAILMLINNDSTF